MSEPVWYVVQTAARSEERAASALREAGIDVYLPRGAHWRTRRHRRGKARRERVVVPLFPRYLFVSFPDRLDWRVIHRSRSDGVLGFVCFDRVPCRASAREIEALQCAEDLGAFDETVDAPRLKIGDEVVLTSGPFDGYVATVDRVPHGAEKPVTVSLIARLVWAQDGTRSRETTGVAPIAMVVPLDMVQNLA